MMRGSFERTPSLLVSAVIHGAAGLAIWFFWPKTPPAQFEFGNSVAINVISDASSAPQAQPADIVPEAVIETPAPEELPPTPAPPTPAAPPPPPPKGFVTQTRPRPAVQSNTPGCSADDFLCSASSSFKPGGGGKPTPTPPSPGGGRPNAGQAGDLTQGELNDLAGPLFQVWEANCRVLGGDMTDVTISVTLTATGHFDGKPHLLRKDGSLWPEDISGNCLNCDSFTSAASARAKAALKKVEPYKVPPRFTGGISIPFHFDPRKFCR